MSTAPQEIHSTSKKSNKPLVVSGSSNLSRSNSSSNSIKHTPEEVGHYAPGIESDDSASSQAHGLGIVVESDGSDIGKDKCTSSSKHENAYHSTNEPTISSKMEDDTENTEEEDDYEYDHDDDDEYEDDDEPALRYKRLGGNIHKLLEKDTASTLIAAERFLVLGTHWGNVIIIDFEGNEIKKWRAHSATVNCVSVDLDGEYVASASDDGRVVICGLYNDDIQAVNYSRPVKAVALDPMYSRKSTRRFVSGGTSGQLIMNEKKWYGKNDTILFTSEGPIQTIQWQNNLIAWACDEGVQIYDTAKGARISHIDRPAGSPRADLFRCRLYWRDPRTLLVAWANFVQVVVLKEHVQHSAPLGFPGTENASGPSLYAEISVVFKTDFIVCGIAIYRDQFLVLSYGEGDFVSSVLSEDQEAVPDEKHQQRSRNAPPPELRMIDRNIEELTSDVLALEGFQLLQPIDYALAFSSSKLLQTASPNPDTNTSSRSPSTEASLEADTWYILSPKQLVSVHPRGLRDHVQWLTERGDYAQALADIEEAYQDAGPWAMYRDQVKRPEYETIGQTYAQLLMDQGELEQAASVCIKSLPCTDTPESVAVWESWVFAFAEANYLQAIAPHIPTSELKLSSTVYEMVLAFLLTTDIAEFSRLVFAWPSSLFNSYSVALAVEDQLEKSTAGSDEAMALMKILAFIYDKLNQPSKSLLYHLRLFEDGILERIQRENLFAAVRDKAKLVMLYDDHTIGDGNASLRDRPIGDGDVSLRDRPIGDSNASLRDRCEAPGVQLLTNNTDAIPPSSVVRQLLDTPESLHVYLHLLLAKDPHLGAPFADLQVELYAEYSPERLLDFLRVSTYYSLEKALEVSEMRSLVPEMVFVLGRMGDNHRALMLIIDRMRDVPRAIEFAKDQNDPELWNDLLMYSRDKPEFILGLLELGGTHINPTKLIRSIPPELTIPGIRRALTNVLHDYHLQVELCTDCRHILDGDCGVLSDGLRHLQHQGMTVDGDQVCLVCQMPLEELATEGDVLAFWCGHMFHDRCILHHDVLQKTKVGTPEISSATVAALGSGRHGRRDNKAYMMQMKLDRTMLIRRYHPSCPVCAEYDQKKRLAAGTGWTQEERRDRGPDTENKADLPPIQTLEI